MGPITNVVASAIDQNTSPVLVSRYVFVVDIARQAA